MKDKQHINMYDKKKSLIIYTQLHSRKVVHTYIIEVCLQRRYAIEHNQLLALTKAAHFQHITDEY